ncbi:hypothetical protein PITCH_A1510027 [uncultured Desulfobacterium sp.]|uniref:Uncharacterized protein n=1 Tax=uncultured Desulfobacterium sp. TaxID=201089 RepID=A0A445MTE4_9BACT|nr:hypothetical protein PITCH_A1510027 [uncultured Desulfobacterium sp.]
MIIRDQTEVLCGSLYKEFFTTGINGWNPNAGKFIIRSILFIIQLLRCANEHRKCIDIDTCNKRRPGSLRPHLSRECRRPVG